MGPPLSPPLTVAGNVWDKYTSTNPVVKAMMRRFTAAWDELAGLAAPQDALDVGCGEGVWTQRLATHHLAAGSALVGLDVESPHLRAAWAQRPDLHFVTGDAQALAFCDGAFDLVSLVEVLQLVHNPPLALAEAGRVARGHVLVTVPREPLWRLLNLTRGAYLAQAGNTPGHLHHFDRRALTRLLAPLGSLVAVRCPPPWILALVAR